MVDILQREEQSMAAAEQGTKMLLKFQCPNRPGIVASVANEIFRNGGDIISAAQFDDRSTDRFFSRMEIAFSGEARPFEQAFASLARDFAMQWSMREKGSKQKVLILVSKFDHCLGDLLYRMRLGELPMECVGIVSNHPESALSLTGHIGLPYRYLPITKETKREQEGQIQELIEETGAELVILARYMQILSDEFSSYLSGRCINIHHSFLPGFKGAKPYHQAYDRGVKMIGATAHYVTEDLDEGPIIAQDVEMVTHADTPEDLVRKGRDIERRVLARAVSYHLEERVLMNGRKTVVFP